MACGDHGGDLGQAAMEGAFRDAVTCAYINDVGVQVWPLIVVGAILAAVFIYTRSAIPVFLMMVVLGPLMVATLPAAASAAVNVLAMMAIPAVGYLVYSRVQTMN